MATSRRDPLRRLQPLLQVVILAFALFCLGIAQEVFIPIASAMLLTFVLSPVVERLERWRFPRVVAVVMTVLLVSSVLAGVGWLLASQVTTLAADLPQYRSNLTAKVRELRRVGKPAALERAQSTVKEVIGELQKDGAAPARKTPPQPVVVENPTPVGFAGLRTMLGPITGLLASVGFVIVLVIFMLMERQRLLERLIRLAGTGRVTLTTKILTDAAERIGLYLQLQSLTNTGFGVAVGTGLFLIGVPYALLFGVLSALLRFVPYIGVWVAAGSAALVTLAIFESWREPVMVVTLYALVELTIYLVVEPLLYSHSAGVSPLALLITLAFWTWLWGPIGLILGTPLTVCLVALGRHIPEMQFIAVLFGDEPVVTIDVAIYQRLLKGDEQGARSVQEAYTKQHARADVYEQVLLPVLARARHDATRGALTADESTAIAEAVGRIVDHLETDGLTTAGVRDEGAPDEGARDEAESAERTTSLRVLACPARDDVDAAALRLLASRVRADGVRVEPADPGTLAAEVLERVATTEPGVVVVASVAEPGLAHARYMLKRLHARFPDLPLVAACWDPRDDADATCASLLDAGASDVATTLGEARERIIQYRQVHAQPVPPRAA